MLYALYTISTVNAVIAAILCEPDMSLAPPSHTGHESLFLMIGDSMIAGFDWQKRIPHFTIKNYGVPGATTSEILRSLPSLKSRHKSAEIILLMIGTNDVAQENFAFTEDLRKIIVYLAKAYPTAEIMVNSLLPMELPYLGKDAVSSVNNHIQTICRQTGSCFIDAYARFLNADTRLLEADGVHINNAGYELWTRTLLEHIAFLVEND
ncbi:GDSL-type esterase/lipase family protein [Desulfosediminicola flagellatus]|uniref:GDSL-type esterase/lipase family protein n=1 Tax=Desulfosediminicola flagellatus TaxID=2569541 RepID=UPI001E55C1E2|nr:GDSL-type esterase/lipase family protein [Desulfosediminicola flagellatus]